MKKGLVILIALAFFGGLAFADDGAMGPTITSGVTSYLGVNVLTSNTDLEDVAGSTDQAAVSELRFGTLPSDTTYNNGYGYYVLPWVKIAQGPFYAQLAPDFFGNKNATLGDTSRYRMELTFGVAGTGYSLSDRIRYENMDVNNVLGATTTTHRIKGDFSMDNLSSGVVFQGTATNNAGTFDDFFNFTTLAIRDYQFGIKGLLGFMDVAVGGIGTDYYYDTNNFRLGAIDWFQDPFNFNVASDNAPADQGFRWIGIKNSTIPIVTTFNIGSLMMSLPLTIRTGVNFPIPAVEWRDFLAYDATAWPLINETPIIASATYAMEGIGTFDIGAIPGFAYTQTTNAGAVYTKSTMDVTNVVFVDANISAIDNLELQAAFDYKTQTSDPSVLDTAAYTGTGTAADPFTNTKVTNTNIWAGLEAVYDLSAMMEGLSIDGALAVASQTGMTTLNQTGTAFAAPTAGANVYIGSNYNDATKYGTTYGPNATPSFIFGAGVTYAINDNNTVSLSDEFDSMAGDLSAIDAAMPGLTSYGFYNTNGISVGYSTVAGKGKLSASLGYTMYLGLPAAADYQITGTNNIAAYNVALANAYKPLVFKVKYAAKY